MKKHFQVSLCAGILFLASCTQADKSQKQAPSADIPLTKADAIARKTPSRIALRTGDGPIVWPEISADSANAASQRWNSMGSSRVGSGSGLLQGFMVPEADLTDMVNEISSDTTVYAQLGIRYNNGPGQVSIIFRVKDAQGHFHYYDFTSPCPPVCPK